MDNPISNTGISKWVWWVSGGIIVALIIAIVYSNNQSKKNSAEAKSLLQSGPLKDEIKQEVKQDVFDILDGVHLAITPPVQ